MNWLVWIIFVRPLSLPPPFSSSYIYCLGRVKVGWSLDTDLLKAQTKAKKIHDCAFSGFDIGAAAFLGKSLLWGYVWQTISNDIATIETFFSEVATQHPTSSCYWTNFCSTIHLFSSPLPHMCQSSNLIIRNPNTIWEYQCDCWLSIFSQIISNF